MAELTLKHQLSSDEYIINANATQAAGYSPKYANTNASELLQNTTIKSLCGMDVAAKTIAYNKSILIK